MNLYIFVQIYCIESKNFSITKRERLSKFSTTARTSTRKHHSEQPSRFYIKQYKWQYCWSGRYRRRLVYILYNVIILNLVFGAVLTTNKVWPFPIRKVSECRSRWIQMHRSSRIPIFRHISVFRSYCYCKM